MSKRKASVQGLSDYSNNSRDTGLKNVCAGIV